MELNFEQEIDSLREAYKKGSLTLYLGAGVSVDSGLPTWERLVLSMYFQTNQDIFEQSRSQPFPNYLFAISEWLLKEYNESLDIITSRIKRHYHTINSKVFLDLIKETLYSAFMDMGQHFGERGNNFLEKNSTLSAIVKLLKNSKPGKSGIGSVISYNYDDLVEKGLELDDAGKASRFKTIFRNVEVKKLNKIPIYHVHGYIPYDNVKGSTLDELIFSEESYHKAAQDAYYWGNMVQMQNLANNTGLMIGLSLSDRNIRRILSALKTAPIKTENYIILKREEIDLPQQGDHRMKFIRDKAEKYLNQFPDGSIKRIDPRQDEFISNVVKQIMENDEDKFKDDIKELGVKLIQVENYSQIGEFINKINNN